MLRCPSFKLVLVPLTRCLDFLSPDAFPTLGQRGHFFRSFSCSPILA